MRSDGSSVLEVVVDSVPSAGSTARRHLDGLSEILSAPILHDLRTVVTELVDNSVRHGSGRPIVIVIEVMPDGVTRGTVSDGGQGPVEIAAPGEPYDSGLGLRIVDVLVSHWGVDPPSSDVWFELPGSWT